MRRVVLTGGPGAGKTTLLAELAARGHATVEESARAIIAARVGRGQEPRPDPATFAIEILKADDENYWNPPGTGLVFFDRSAVEALAMIHEASPVPDEELDARLSVYRFHQTVFILPPWEAIFANDAERTHSFAHAVAVHGRLVYWYRRCGYRLNEVPRLNVAQRADHVLRAIASDS